MVSTLRLIPNISTPADELSRTLEALLVVAAQPLSIEDMATAAEADAAEVEAAIEILRERFSEERSGIVLEHVAGGFAFRAAAAA
ncbi:MAG TPA: SMC-Scp complex subunit ScpB, partial [Gaiellaceae bacterium]|nr:SMC-Scp complex subunit ScpB [Gaiellaceae bacterium]